MNNAHSFLRWGIPGWTVALGFLIFILGDYVSANDDTMFQLVNHALSFESIWQVLVAGTLVAGAGVPLGFIIYQVYFYLRWNSPVSKAGLLPPLIVGRMEDLQKTLRDLKDKDLSLQVGWRKKMLRASESHQATWYYVSPLLREAFVALDSAGVLSDRHAYLMNVLHSLGASILGLGLGFAVYVLTKWRLGQAELWWSVVALAVTLITVLLLSIEESRQEKPLKVLSITVSHPAELFLASVIFLYVGLNPGLNAALPPNLPLLLCVLFGILWGWSIKGDRQTAWVLTPILSLAILFARTSVVSLLDSLNWPLLFSIIVFVSCAPQESRQCEGHTCRHGVLLPSTLYHYSDRRHTRRQSRY